MSWPMVEMLLASSISTSWNILIALPALAASWCNDRSGANMHHRWQRLYRPDLDIKGVGQQRPGPVSSGPAVQMHNPAVQVLAAGRVPIDLWP